MATWRCTICDTAVCEQHRNHFWPGQGRGNLRLADRNEWLVWDEAVQAGAGSVRAGATEACTLCRARLGASMLDRYRRVPRPLPSRPFPWMLTMARAGVWTRAFFTTAPAPDFVVNLRQAYLNINRPPRPAFTVWNVEAGRTVKGSSPMFCFAFATTDGRYLLCRTDHLAVSGPLVLASFGNHLLPTPSARDTIRQPISPKTNHPAPYGDHARYQLRWRSVGNRPQDLGVDTYLDLLRALL